MKTTMMYRVEIWASEDSCEEYWSDHPLSSFYTNIKDAEKKLEKYKNMSEDDLIRNIDYITSVRDNRPRIVAYKLFES